MNSQTSTVRKGVVAMRLPVPDTAGPKDSVMTSMTTVTGARTENVGTPVYGDAT